MALEIINYPLKKNRCYQQNVKRTPIGIQIHSIGCAQGTGKAVADSFNNNTVAEFVTYVCDADVAGRAYKCGSEELYTWADAGYGNRNLITIEIAESDYMKYTPNSAKYTVTDAAKFEADILRGYDTAVLLCAEICARRKWDPFTKLEHGLHLISSHDEGRIAGVSSGHVDPTHIWSKFGLSMDTFRRAVKVAMERGSAPSGESVIKYRVRKSWTDVASQTNAYENLELAKAEADRYPGYSVFDEEGKAVYTSAWYNVGIPSSKEAFIEAVAQAAKKLYSKTKILPSVVIGQCCVETGYGLGSDSTALVEVNNLLGMKKDLINSTWKDFTVWKGKTIKKLTPEEVNGKVIKKYDYFRVYDNYDQCIEDYEMFLLNVKNDAGYKYRSVAGKTDPKEVITIISKGGYATDSGYITKVMNMINTNNLTKYDKEVIPTTTPAKKKYAVRRKLAETKYELGRFSALKNAKKVANENWGYRVYDLETKKAVYTPNLTMKQKFIANMIWFDIYVRDDNAKGKQWYYYNTERKSLGSFWETRKAGKRCTNCSGAVQLALYAAGVPKRALRWYFAKNRIVWLDDKAKKDFLEFFDIIKLREKILKEYIEDGTVVPGDVLGYKGFGHTNAYVMPGYTFDAGHLWCEGKGEGAKYTKWVGPLAYGNRKPAYAFRLKK